MKRNGKILLAVLALAISIIACGDGGDTAPPEKWYGGYGKGYTETECELNWDAMNVDPGDEVAVAQLIISRNQLPGTVGYALKVCIEDGWMGYR